MCTIAICCHYYGVKVYCIVHTIIIGFSLYNYGVKVYCIVHTIAIVLFFLYNYGVKLYCIVHTIAIGFSLDNYGAKVSCIVHTIAIDFSLYNYGVNVYCIVHMLAIYLFSQVLSYSYVCCIVHFPEYPRNNISLCVVFRPRTVNKKDYLICQVFYLTR